MYKCKDCNKQFIGGKRRDKSQVITDYVEGKQTLMQLSAKYNVSERTIRRDLEGMRFVHSIAKYKEVTIQHDTTYWGRNFGLMVIKDVLRNKVLGHKYVRNETIAQYVEGVCLLAQISRIQDILSRNRRYAWPGTGLVSNPCSNVLVPPNTNYTQILDPRFRP